MDYQPSPTPRIESLRIRNYRVLHDVELKGITPLAVFIGPNGSGKSTIFDVFAFLADCFSVGLRKAVESRGRFKELRSRDALGPIVIELKYREQSGIEGRSPVITYHLAVDEDERGVYVAEEWLQWKRGSYGRPFKFLEFHSGQGEVISGDMPADNDSRIPERLISPDVLAVSTLGQLARNPRVSALRSFITGWYLSHLSADSTRNLQVSGAQERLSETGDNLANVLQYLREHYPEHLRSILKTLSDRVPRLKGVDVGVMPDGRLLLEIEDAPFHTPIQARFVSDGTLKLLAYLIVLHDPHPPKLIGIEEPENHLHPRLLVELAEECRLASATSQLIVTTHSPFFVNALQPGEVRILDRASDGYTRAVRAADIQNVREFVMEGADLGSLWMEGYFGVGDPLTGQETRVEAIDAG